MRALSAEVASLRAQLAQTTAKKQSAGKKAAKTEIEDEPQGPMERDSEEESRIIELLKEMDEANKARQDLVKAANEKKREEEAKYLAAQKRAEEAALMAKEVEEAQAKAEAEKRMASKGAASATKKSTDTETKSAKKASKKSSAKAKRKTSPKQQSAPPATAASDDDAWSSLSDSTLKRKTVAQITEYLTEKVSPSFVATGSLHALHLY